jgi:GNAT superfamily N-acetyltransferase
MRTIVPSDATSIVDMLRLLRQESPTYNHVDDDPEWVEGNLKLLLEAEALTGVIEPNKGFMIGAIADTWYSKIVHATEQLLYIDPDFRGGMLAVRLIKSFEALARAGNAVDVHAGATTGMQDERTRALYMRLGYELHGLTLRKKL